ncbi:MAG: hypothetical protein JW913_11295 [Chitinispirillaceae bacterium]|nr:hypothetical protein [Chitinispirillaceae bacterium]
MVVQLLAGMFLGSIIVSLVWGFIVKSGKNKVDDSNREREEVMRSLGELWVEIDLLFSSHRRGATEEQAFREAFSSKIEEVNKLLKPNLHMLDVYYVKYIENLIAGYGSVALKGGEPVENIIDTSSDSDRETDFSVVEQPEPSDLSELPRTADDKKETAAAVPEPPAGETAAEEVVTVEQEKKTTAPETEVIFTPDEKTNGEAEAAPLSIADEVSELEVLIPPEKETLPAEEDSALPEKAVETPKEEPVLEAEESFEPKPAEVPDKKPVPDQAVETLEKAASPVKAEPAPTEGEEITFEDSSEATRETIYGLEEAVFESDESDRKSTTETAPLPEKKPAADFFDEEEFSMETLMDVDINTISPFIKDGSGSKAAAPMDIQEQAVFEVSADAGEEKAAAAEESLEVVIASNVSHTEKPQKEGPEAPPVKDGTNEKKAASKEGDVISEETTYTRADELADKAPEEKAAAGFSADEDFEAIFEQGPVAKAPADLTHEKLQGGVTQADLDAFDKEEEIITGDDVVEKIASWEFNKPAASAKPPVKKEKKKEKTASAKSGGAKTHSTAGTKSHAFSGKKSSPPAASKTKGRDDAITGDDVADKIDAFFGLFDK